MRHIDMRNLDLGDGAVPVEMPISLTQRMVTDPTIVTDATVIFDGPYDLGVLEAAAHVVCRRHDATRTTVDLDENRQTVHGFRADAVGFHVHRASTDGLMPTVDRLARTPLNPATLPVFRLLAVVESARRMALHLSLPHAVADISAIEIVMRELMTSYAALLKGEAPALPVTRQHADHLRRRDLVCADPATWREDGTGSRAAAFWSGKLSGSRPPPFDRPPRGRPEGDRTVFLRERIDGDLRSRLQQVCAQERCSLFHLTLAAFEEAVATQTAEPDITTMCMVHGRGEGDLQNTVGMLICDIAFRRQVRAPSRRRYLAAVATDAWITHMHQGIRLSELADRVPEVGRLYRDLHFRSMFLQFRPQRIGAGLEHVIDGVELSFPPGPRAMLGCSWPGMALFSVDDVGDGLAVELMFDRRRWAAAQMERLHDGFIRCLRAYASDLEEPVEPARA